MHIIDRHIRYNNYHKHTHYSNIMTPDCIVRVEDYAKRAIELGHTTLVTTEHGYAGNIFEYYDVAKKYGLKFVFGIEYYYVPDRFEKDRTNSHLMILAKNKRGMNQMLKIMSEASLTGYYHKPRIDKELLFSLNPEDVVVTSTCVISYIAKYEDYEEEFVKPLIDYFGDNFYLEIHDNTHPMQVKYNEVILELHNKYNIPLIHATDSHYIHEEDDKKRTIFLNGKGIFYPEEEGFILDYPTSEKIFERYEEQGVFSPEQVESALKNTWIIDDFEDIVMDKEIKMPSIYPDLTHEEKVGKLKKVINTAWVKDREEIAEEKHQEYLDGIRFEMDIIESTKMEDYFLLNEKIIKQAVEDGGILTRTGRGSAPSFYLNKLLGFTNVDRVDAPITLFPTRFMSKSRILETKSLPDIDFNTANPEVFIEASKKILGQDNVYYMTAYGTMQESSAFRNICRSHGLDMAEYNEVAKNIDRYRKHIRWQPLIEEAQEYVGVIDSVSPHPCAVLLLDKPISEEVGLIRTGDEKKGYTYCALIDSGTSDEWKFLKNDFLSVTVWDIISKVYDELDIPIHSIREIMELVEHDEKVWELYDKGITATLNQTGTQNAIPQVMKYKPKSVRELSAFVAGIRPAFESMKQTFLNREEFHYGIPEFDAILETSENFILYQENIMATLVYVGFEEDETYALLKAIAKKKKGIIEPIEEKFIQGFTKQTGSEDNAWKVWQIVQDAVGYGFNSSHSLSVALDSCYGAYLKAHYPLVYYAVVMNIYEDDVDVTEQLYKELEYFNIKVENPIFGKAQSKYSYDHENNTIIKGMKSIKYINNDVAGHLLDLSEKKDYDNFVDLLRDIVEQTKVNARQISILIRLNFFRQFGLAKELMMIFEKFQERFKKTHKDATKEKRIAEIKDYVDEMGEVSDYRINEMVMFEKDMLGYVLSTDTSYSKLFGVVIATNTKYTPWVTLYIPKTGKEVQVKVSKENFFDENKEHQVINGDLVKILDLNERPKKVKEGNRWVDSSEMQMWLNTWELIHRIKKEE